MVSCEKEETGIQSVTGEFVFSIEESDALMEDIASIFDEVFLEEESGLSAKSEEEKREIYLPECAVKTVVRSQGMKTVTIDFGDRCSLINEKVLKGKLLMTYSFDKELKTRTVTHGYDNFFVNGKGVSGSSSSVKEKSNINGNRQTTFTESIIISWESGETASREGTRVSEMIAGNEEGSFGSRVYEISGSWTTTNKQGEVHSVTITKKLRKEMSCRYIVSGSKEIRKGEVSSVFDFGDGSCDSIATFTDDNGIVKEIELKRNHKK